MDYRDIWRELINRHLGKILGGILFFLLGIIYLKFGFLRTLFLLLITALGIYIGGSKLDGSREIQDYLGSLWPVRRYRS